MTAQRAAEFESRRFLRVRILEDASALRLFEAVLRPSDDATGLLLTVLATVTIAATRRQKQETDTP
jgi:hypothetical protein